MPEIKLTKEQRREINRLKHAEAQAIKHALPAAVKDAVKEKLEKAMQGTGSKPLRMDQKKSIEQRLDDAEAALDALITVDRNPVAIMFFLKTQGRKRGYIEHAPDDKIDLDKLKAIKDFFDSVNGFRPSEQIIAAVEAKEIGDQQKQSKDQHSDDIVSVHESSLSHSLDDETVEQDKAHSYNREPNVSHTTIPIIDHDPLLCKPAATTNAQANLGLYKVQSGPLGSSFA